MCSLSGFGVVSQGGERGRAVAARTLLGKRRPAAADKERGGGLGPGVAAAERFDVRAVKWFSKK